MTEDQKKIILGFLEYEREKWSGPWWSWPKIKPWLIVAGIFSLTAYTAWTAYDFKVNGVEQPKKLDLLLLAAIFLALLSVPLRRSTQALDYVHWILRAILHESPKAPDTDEGPRHWPWGAHHTDLLGHLEAAAKQFWVLYDPTDPTTAPTNELVADWLRSQRGVSKDKAQAIASILRADGLKTGPRK